MTPAQREKRNSLLTTAGLCALGGVGILATFGAALIPAVIAATLFFTATVAALKAATVGSPNRSLPNPNPNPTPHVYFGIGVKHNPTVRRMHTRTNTHGHTHHGHGHHTRKVHVDTGHDGTPAKPVAKGHTSSVNPHPHGASSKSAFTTMFSGSRSTGNSASTIRSHASSSHNVGFGSGSAVLKRRYN